MGWFKKDVKKAYFGGAVKRKSLDTEVPAYISRVAPEKLELAFISEPVMFSGVTIWQNLIYETRPFVHSGDTRIQKRIDWVFKKTQFVETMYSFAPRHLCIYGNAFIEILRKEGEKPILDIIADDPKQMDFQTNMNKVVFDENGRPKGYVMKRVGENIPFSRDEMIHLAVNQINRGEMGIGIIEPVYKDIELKENIEQAKAESAFRQGFALPGVEFGSDDNPPDTEMEATAKRIAEDMADERTIAIAYPYYFKPRFIELPTGTGLEGTLDYQTKLQAAVLGVPLGVLLNTGERGGARGLEPLIDFLECRLKAFQKALRIEEIVSLILESHGLEPNFKVGWKPLTEKSVKESLMRFYRMARVGMINAGDKEVQSQLREILGMKQAPIGYRTETDNEEEEEI